jgi:hypothetical protein
MRTALVAGASVVAALSAGAARAEDGAAAGPTFAVELKLDELIVAIDEPATSAIPVSSAPFLNTPAFELGLPSLARSDLRIADAFGMDSDSCARCNDIAARLGVSVGEQDVSVSVGATASVADRLDSFSSSGQRPGWYLFVAADAQAMSWGFDNNREHSSSVRLDDMRMLGDAQAGIGRTVGGGDLAIGYISREVSHMGAERRENFVGLTFGWEG